VVAIESAAPGVFLKDGTGANGFALTIGDTQSPHIAAVGTRVATYGNEVLTLRRIDRRRQEDGWAATWSGAGVAWLALDRARPIDLSREANGAMVLEIEFRTTKGAAGPVTLAVDDTALPVGSELAGSGSWRTLRVPLRCFGQKGGDLTKVSRIRLQTAAALGLDFSEISLRETAAGDRCPAS
jgi:beta-glucosidase